jgi:hypothetical protein
VKIVRKQNFMIILPWIIPGSLGTSFKAALEEIIQSALVDLKMKFDIDRDEQSTNITIKHENDYFTINILANTIILQFLDFNENERLIVDEIVKKIKESGIDLPKEILVSSSVTIDSNRDKLSKLVTFRYGEDYIPASIRLIHEQKNIRELITIEQVGIFSSQLVLLVEVISEDLYEGITHVISERSKMLKILG